ncbi:MAG: glycosyltransferase family 4 protein, partial [Chloroflexi bacterium]|nr:glycosyltransferase family 4 protein [Chloroflexota bacterium]
MGLRLLHVVSHPIQYFVPLYRTLAQRDDIEMTVLFCSTTGLTSYSDPGFGANIAWDIPLTTGYRSYFLARASAIDAAQGPLHVVNPDVATWIRRLHPDVLWVHGYTIPTSLIAIAAATFLRIPVLLRDEATLLDTRPASREAIRRLTLGPLFRRCHCCYIGTANRDYYRHYGVAERQLHHVPYSVDNAFFRAQYEHWLPQRQTIRAELGINDDRPIILFAGKLVPKKDPLTLVRAFSQLSTQRTAHLLFCGDGPLRPEVEALAASAAPGAVSITGFVNQSAIGKYYTAADLLV